MINEGMKALKGVTHIVAPQTIMEWFRKLVAKKFDRAKKERVRDDIRSIPGL